MSADRKSSVARKPPRGIGGVEKKSNETPESLDTSENTTLDFFDCLLVALVIYLARILFDLDPWFRQWVCTWILPLVVAVKALGAVFAISLPLGGLYGKFRWHLAFGEGVKRAVLAWSKSFVVAALIILALSIAAPLVHFVYVHQDFFMMLCDLFAC